MSSYQTLRVCLSVCLIIHRLSITAPRAAWVWHVGLDDQHVGLDSWDVGAHAQYTLLYAVHRVTRRTGDGRHILKAMLGLSLFVKG